MDPVIIEMSDDNSDSLSLTQFDAAVHALNTYLIALSEQG